MGFSETVALPTIWSHQMSGPMDRACQDRYVPCAHFRVQFPDLGPRHHGVEGVLYERSFDVGEFTPIDSQWRRTQY